MPSILVVDDEPEIRENICDLFEVLGHSVFQASNGVEALDLLKDKIVDLVITDVRMPKGNGVFLLEEIRKRNQSIPIVVMITGFAEISREEAIDKGANELILKPFSFDDFEALINKLLLTNAAN